MAEEGNTTFEASGVNTTYEASGVNKTYPDLSEFYSNLTPFVISSIFISALLFTLNTAIFATTISQVKRRLTTSLLLPTTFLCSIYPLISLAAFLTILLPKSWLIFHTVMHLSFTVGAVVFHKLCFRYVSSDSSEELGDQKEILDLKTSPCCCCCTFLPNMIPTRTKLFFVKCLIWQMPLVQSSIMITLNVIYYRDSKMYEHVLIFFVPFLVSSIVTGLWGLNITVKMINKLCPDYNLMKKMFCLQLILLLCKLQYAVLDSQLLTSLDFGGIYPITNTIYKQTFINILILVEMTLVSILVQNAYHQPVEL